MSRELIDENFHQLPAETKREGKAQIANKELREVEARLISALEKYVYAFILLLHLPL